MPEPGGRSLVTNTTPLIALTAATGGFAILKHLYRHHAAVGIADKIALSIPTSTNMLEDVPK